MPDPQHRQLSEELNSIVLRDPKFRAYVRSMRELEQQISDLYKPDAQGFPLFSTEKGWPGSRRST